MKYSTFLFLIVCSVTSVSLARESYGQKLLDLPVTLQLKEVTLAEALDKIAHQTKAQFVLIGTQSFQQKTTQLSAEQEGLGSVLVKLLSPYQLDYQVVDNRIVIQRPRQEPSSKRKPSLQEKERTTDLSRWLLKNRAERVNRPDFVPIRITGKVSDENGGSLPGVSILLKGSQTGGITDSSGQFSINVPDRETVLVFSFVGYLTQEIVIGNRIFLDISMQVDQKLLDELVVVGYGTMKKSNLSGAVESVPANKLERRATPNIGLALQGLVPNLTITPNGGAADASPSFNIRGMTSINGGEPLILVDGVPTNAADFSRMNPADIENLSVLKDASSAAIYGARAAYGVILVTSKRGNSEKLTVNFNSSYTIKRNGRMPRVVLDPYIQSSYKQIMGQPWYNLYDEQDIEYAKKRVDNPSLPVTIPGFIDPSKWSHLGATDWYNEVFDNVATSNRHNLSLSGRTSRTNYYFAAEHARERGMVKHNKDVFKKYNLRSRLEFTPIRWLTVGSNLSLLNVKYNRPTNLSSSLFVDALRSNSLLPVNNPDGTWTMAREGTTNLGNVVGILKSGGLTSTNQYLLQTQFTANIDLIKDVWAINADYTSKYNSVRERGWSSDRAIPFRDGEDLPIYYTGKDNYAKLGSATTNYNLLNLYSSLNKKIGSNQFLALVGFSQEYERYEHGSSQRKDLITDTYPTLQLATGEMIVAETIYDWAIRSGFFRLNYNFKERYLIEVNGRYDGSSRFPKNDRFGFFPSVSGAWVISEEPFLRSLPVISYLKIRASYGSLGNQDVGYYQYIANMSADRMPFLLNGERPMGVYPPGLVSNRLTWERVNSGNIGIDLNLFSEKITIAADIYRRETKDMLTKGRTLPNVLGAAEPSVNAADLRTDGWEISVGFRDRIHLDRSDLRVSARVNLSDNKAVITRFDNPTGFLDDYYVGQKIGEIWGLTTEGFFNNKSEIDNHADQWEVIAYPGNRALEPGDLKYRDINGDGKINKGSWTKDDPGDFKVIGNTTSRYSFGLDLDLEWKGFDFRMLLQGVAKKDWYPSGYKFFGVYFAPWGNVLEHNLDHWTPETPDAYFPRLKSYLANGAGDMSYSQTRYLQNAAYLKLRNLSIGYTLPANLTQRIGTNGVRFYISGDNLAEFTKLIRAFDPEALDQTSHPFQRSFSVGLNVNF